MCVNGKYVYNRYIRRTLFVDCGKCPACKQAKAARRASRIRNNIKNGEIALFLTLTYRNEYVPYVWIKDVADGVNELEVYREKTVRLVRSKIGYRQKYAVGKGELIDKFLVDYPFRYEDEKYPVLRGRKDRMGVLYYRDLQNFIKRLRINLKRDYGYEGVFTFFACSEYGPSTGRPHFHALIFIRPSDEKMFRTAIVKSWPFADSSRTAKYIEVARDAASYVSSYVNCSSNIPSFLQSGKFAPKHSYSKGFGLAHPAFQLSNILAQVDNGTCGYSKLQNRNGVKCIVDVPIPEYVINRYFPKLKGFTRLAPDTLAELLQRPSRLFEFRRELDYSDDDLHRLSIRLAHCLHYYLNVTGRSPLDYANDYLKVWRVRSSYCLRHSFDDVKPIDFGAFYENINEYVCGHVRSFSLDECNLSYYVEDPNEQPWRVKMTNNLLDLYIKMQKQRKVTNEAMSQTGRNV